MTATQSIAWLDMRLRVPADWEIVRHSVRTAAGRLVFVDRREQRLLLTWADCPTPPDTDRLFADYRARDEVTAATPLPVTDGWSGYRTATLTRAGRYDPHHRRWIELTITAPGQETALLQQFAIATTNHRREWRAFGFAVETPADWSLAAVDIQPAAATCTFRRQRAEVRVRRLGMTETWFKGDLEKFLQPQVTGTFRTMTHRSHPAGLVESREVGHRWQRLLGRLRPRHDLAWHCPVNHAVFQLTTLSAAPVDEIVVRCCGEETGS
jgi:hypothetical protein